MIKSRLKKQKFHEIMCVGMRLKTDALAGGSSDMNYYPSLAIVVVACSKLLDDRNALQLAGFSACAFFHRQCRVGGTLFTSEYCLGGRYSLVNYVWGTLFNIHSNTV